MMNLLGCSKENFYKLMTYMDYKKDKSIDTYIFKGERKKKWRNKRLFTATDDAGLKPSGGMRYGICWVLIWRFFLPWPAIFRKALQTVPVCRRKSKCQILYISI